VVEDSDNTPTPIPTRSAASRPAIDDDDVHTRTTQDHHSGRVDDTLRTAEINLERDRRDTLTSPISALIAESMSDIAETRGRDPDAPQGEGVELTRRVGDTDRQLARSHAVQAAAVASNDPNAQRRQRAAHLIDQSRALMESGALTGAVVAAEQALDEAERASPPGIAEVIEPARPLLSKVFAAYVGDLSEVPVMAKRIETISPLGLDDRRRAVLALVDGQRTLEEVLAGARLHGADGLRIAASLLRAGILRVV
jgi:hypothetical protein